MPLFERAVANTETFIEVKKINASINNVRQQLPAYYAKLGEAYYSLFSDGSGIPELQSHIDDIKAAYAEIAGYQNMILKVKGIEQCQSCGAEILTGSSFCSNCGAKVIREKIQIDTPRCPQCGAVVGIEDLFCMECGTKLHGRQNEDRSE